MLTNSMMSKSCMHTRYFRNSFTRRGVHFSDPKHDLSQLDTARRSHHKYIFIQRDLQLCWSLYGCRAKQCAYHFECQWRHKAVDSDQFGGVQ